MSGDPSVACLERTSSPIDVWWYTGSVDDVVTARTPANWATATFGFPASAISGSTGTSLP